WRPSPPTATCSRPPRTTPGTGRGLRSERPRRGRGREERSHEATGHDRSGGASIMTARVGGSVIDGSAWRGIAQDADAERTAAEGNDEGSTVRLRRSSRALLGSLLRPHRGALALAVVLLLIQNAAAMAGPYLV